MIKDRKQGDAVINFPHDDIFHLASSLTTGIYFAQESGIGG